MVYALCIDNSNHEEYLTLLKKYEICFEQEVHPGDGLGARPGFVIRDENGVRQGPFFKSRFVVLDESN